LDECEGGIAHREREAIDGKAPATPPQSGQGGIVTKKFWDTSWRSTRALPSIVAPTHDRIPAKGARARPAGPGRSSNPRHRYAVDRTAKRNIL
jgi:hypothetical protein